MCNRNEFHSRWGNFEQKFREAGHGHHGKHHGRHFEGGRRRFMGQMPPVNVQETDDNFVLFLFAPGLTKGDFQINVKDNLLTISSQKAESDLAEALNWRRQEYRPGNFERSFVLNEKVDVANISATYEEGVLKVTLPKLPGMETKRQDVFVA